MMRGTKGWEKRQQTSCTKHVCWNRPPAGPKRLLQTPSEFKGNFDVHNPLNNPNNTRENQNPYNHCR